MDKAIEVTEGVFVNPGTKIKIVRTLVFTGTAEAVFGCLERAWLGPRRPAQHVVGMVARETSRVVEIEGIIDPTYNAPPDLAADTIAAENRRLRNALYDIANPGPERTRESLIKDAVDALVRK